VKKRYSLGDLQPGAEAEEKSGDYGNGSVGVDKLKKGEKRYLIIEEIK